MSTDGFDPGFDPIDDAALVSPAEDDEFGADIADLSQDQDHQQGQDDAEDAARGAGDLFAAHPLADDDAIEALCAFGGPLEITPDPVADAELEQWLEQPVPDGPTRAQLVELDQLLRARLAQE